MQHSTWLEAENGTQVVQCLINQGMEDTILVMDNQAWTSAGRNLSCRAVEMAEQISALARVLDAAPHARLFIVFHPREDGTEADGISKAYIVRADGQLHCCNYSKLSNTAIALASSHTHRMALHAPLQCRLLGWCSSLNLALSSLSKTCCPITH